MTRTKRLQKASYATLLSLLLLVTLAPAAAADHCHEEEPCEPYLEVTGAQIHPNLNPFGDGAEVYSGWTLVDVSFPAHCDCFIEGVSIEYRVVKDFAPQGYSAGIESTQVDGDTWAVHALDWDLYEVYFTVYYYCEDGSYGHATTTWLQRN